MTRRVSRRLATRWRSWGRYAWRAGFQCGEWWIGVRFDRQSDAVILGFLGLLLLVGRR